MSIKYGKINGKKIVKVKRWYLITHQGVSQRGKKPQCDTPFLLEIRVW